MDTTKTTAKWYHEDIEQMRMERNRLFFEREQELYDMTRVLFRQADFCPLVELPWHVIKLKCRQMTADFLKQHKDQIKLGGYEPIDVERWQVKSVMDNQPEWRKKWIAKYRNIKEYVEAPRRLRIDPAFCPTPR